MNARGLNPVTDPIYADYRSITLEEINALAKKYLKAENAMLISIKPAS